MVAQWWLGRVGAMRSVRPPARDYDRSADDAPATYRGTGGGAAVDRGVLSPRLFRYSWNWLDRSDWSVLAGLRSRSFGPGPYALVDGATPNFLTANQAAATAPLRGADGFDAVQPDGYQVPSVSSATTPVQVGDRSAAWTLPAVADLSPSWTGSVTQGQTSSHDLVVPPGTSSLTVSLPGVAALSNPGFEGDTSGWTTFGGTLARSTAQAHTGTASGLFTPDGASAGPWLGPLVASSPAVGVGGNYQATIWVYSPGGYSTGVRLNLEWHDSGGSLLSTVTGTNTAISAGVWTQLTVSGVAPSGTVTASPRVVMTGTPTTSNTLYVDDLAVVLADDLDLYLDLNGSQVAASATAGTSVEQIILSNPAAGTYQVQVTGTTVASSAPFTVTTSMTVPSPASTAVLELAHPIVAGGYPTPAGASWTLSAWVQASAAVTVTAALVWRDNTGAALSTSTAAASVDASGWVRLAVTGQAPTGAVTVGVQVQAPLGTVLTVYVGAARLALEDTGTDWFPGEGLPMVSIVDMTETVPVYDRRTASLSLQEVTG